MYTIVYARAEKTALVPTGKYITRDRNLFPEYRATWEGRAGVYLNEGSSADVATAKQRLEPEGYTIFKFDTKESEPLAKARAIVVERATKSELNYATTRRK